MKTQIGLYCTYLVKKEIEDQDVFRQTDGWPDEGQKGIVEDRLIFRQVELIKHYVSCHKII